MTVLGFGPRDARREINAGATSDAARGHRRRADNTYRVPLHDEMASSGTAAGCAWSGRVVRRNINGGMWVVYSGRDRLRWRQCSSVRQRAIKGTRRPLSWRSVRAGSRRPRCRNDRERRARDPIQAHDQLSTQSARRQVHIASRSVLHKGCRHQGRCTDDVQRHVHVVRLTDRELDRVALCSDACAIRAKSAHVSVWFKVRRLGRKRFRQCDRMGRAVCPFRRGLSLP